MKSTYVSLPREQQMKLTGPLLIILSCCFYNVSCSVSGESELETNASEEQQSDEQSIEANSVETSSIEGSGLENIQESEGLLELFDRVLKRSDSESVTVAAATESSTEGSEAPADASETPEDPEAPEADETPEFCKISEPSEESLRAKFASRLDQYVDLESIKDSMRETCAELKNAMKAAKEELEEGDSLLAVGLFAVSLKSGFGWMLMSYNDFVAYQASIAGECHDLTKGKEQRFRERGKCAVELRKQGWGIDEETGEQTYPDYIKSLHVQLAETDNEITRKSFALGAVAQTTIQGEAAEIITGGSSFYAAVGAGGGLAVLDDVTNTFYYAVGLGFIDTLGNEYANAVGGEITY